MLGGLGETSEDASASARALAGLGRLVMIVLGGRDAYRGSRAALEALGDESSVLNVSALRSIKIGKDVLIPWAGAEQGRYALDETRCGFSARDVDEAAQQLGPASADERRWLASWQAPLEASAGQPTHAIGELSADLVRLAERLGVRGTLAAWPTQDAPTAPGPLADARAPRAWGPMAERPDGTLAPHAVMIVAFEASGARVE